MKGRKIKPALLALEDGRVFRGASFGVDSDAEGELVFNTAMTGYQEVLTDPSYRGQMVVMTYPTSGITASSRAMRNPAASGSRRSS